MSGPRPLTRAPGPPERKCWARGSQAAEEPERRRRRRRPDQPLRSSLRGKLQAPSSATARGDDITPREGRASPGLRHVRRQSRGESRIPESSEKEKQVRRVAVRESGLEARRFRGWPSPRGMAGGRLRSRHTLETYGISKFSRSVHHREDFSHPG